MSSVLDEGLIRIISDPGHDLALQSTLRQIYAIGNYRSRNCPCDVFILRCTKDEPDNGLKLEVPKRER